MTLQSKQRRNLFAGLSNTASGLRSRFTCISLAIGLSSIVGCNVESDQAAKGSATDSAVNATAEDAAGASRLQAAAADSSAAQAVAEAEAASEKTPPSAGLSIGDPNPGLKLAKFVKGEEVTAPLKDDVTVVEFWATWCGPCRAGMPHISELQREYGDTVRFVGVTTDRKFDFLYQNRF